MGLRVTGGLASGLAGVGMSAHLSQQVRQDIQLVYESVKDSQDQVDSLAEVVLQSRGVRPPADEGGLWPYRNDAACARLNPTTSRKA